MVLLVRKAVTGLGLSFMLLLILPALPRAQEGRTGLQSAPALALDIQDRWKRYQELEDTGDQESADVIANRLIELNHRAGYLSNDTLARAFAMRGWQHQQAGKIDFALKSYQLAVRLNPSAREYRIALAAAMFTRNPLDIGGYFPHYWNAFWGSFETVRGRYLLLADFSLWIGVALLLAGCLWYLAMLIRYLSLLHHSLMEFLTAPFTFSFASIIALVLIASPLFISIPLHWYALGLAAACWAFQDRNERVLSVAALALLAAGTGLITLSSQMALGLTTPEIQSAFSSELHDANDSAVQALGVRLEEELFDEQGRFTAPKGRKQRLELFVYALGLRKQGFLRGINGLDLYDAFKAVEGQDTLGRLASVNAANVILERENFTLAQSMYENALTDNASRSFAVYNLWRLNNSFRSRSEAQEFWTKLHDEDRQFVRRYSIDEDRFRPELIDATLNNSLLTELVERGLASAVRADTERIRLPDLYFNNLFGPESLWVAIAFAGMLVSYIFFGYVGISTVCRSCGKVYCRRCEIDPKFSRICHACSALKASKSSIDAELRSDQMNKIEHFKVWKRYSGLVINVLIPGMGNAIGGRSFSAGGLLLGWSVLIALLYSAGRMPRAESFPFFSHWTLLMVGVAFVLAVSIYLLAIWQFWREK